MILNWFDSSAAAEAGTHLAESFMLDVLTSAKKASEKREKRQGNAVLKLLSQAHAVSRELHLNIYKRAILANAFKWRLLEKNFDTEFVNGTARTLLLHLCFGANAGAKTLPVSQASVDQAEHYYRSGNESLAPGKAKEAIASYRRAIKLNPGHALAFARLGRVLLDIGQYDEAEIHSRHALELAPDVPEAYNVLGCALHRKRRFAEAETSFRQALKLEPDYTDALYGLASMLFGLGRFDEAESYLKQVLDANPGHTDALIQMGHEALNKGRFAEATEHFRRVLAIQPRSPGAWAALVHARKMTLDDADWLSTAKEIVKDGLPPRQEATLQYAMGKYCDDVKAFDQAFQHYRRANKLLMSLGDKYDRRKRTLLVNDMIRVYNRELLSGMQKGASATTRPAFIVGMMRSGTSLVEQIIATHPAVYGAGELNYWTDAFINNGKATQDAKFGKDLLQKLADDYLQLLPGAAANAQLVVNKLPANFTYLGLIHAVFPHARIIHVQRNPIDTCLSNYFQDFSAGFNFTNDLEDLAHYYREYHRLMAHWRAVLPADVFLDVSYERLVEAQEEWSRRIVGFLGLEWDERCLAFYNTERRVGTASNWQVRQKVFQTSVERWRNYEKHVGPLTGLLELR
jgi:tetratricopeptide (TPR) repeat protein